MSHHLQRLIRLIIRYHMSSFVKYSKIQISIKFNPPNNLIFNSPNLFITSLPFLKILPIKFIYHILCAITSYICIVLSTVDNYFDIFENYWVVLSIAFHYIVSKTREIRWITKKIFLFLLSSSNYIELRII